MAWETTDKAVMDACRADIPENHNVKDNAPWRRCSVALADDMRGAVPPIYLPQGFACGEPLCHTPEGKTVHLCFRAVGEAYECRYSTLKNARNPQAE